MAKQTKIVSISLGSNLGNKEQNLTFAIKKIEQRIGKVLEKSDFFKSQPFGFLSESNFLNCCCTVQTSLSINELISVTQEIEIEMGRRKSRVNEYEDRIIDIDIIFYENEIINEPHVNIPHKNFRKRDFVLIPLKQISNQIDPETFISIFQFTK
jgi:2-amino-4-hydroxy-6-hydroxymethyldihydropteridine diphosphokinase